MNSTLLAASAVCLGFFSLPAAAALASQTAPVPIPTFLLIGQSNAEGYGAVGTGPGQLDPNDPLALPQSDVEIFSFATWTFEPLHAGVNTQISPQDRRFGPEVSLGRLLAEHYGGTVRILKYTMGATYLFPSAGPGTIPAPSMSWDPATGGLYFALSLLVPFAQSIALSNGESLDVRGVFWVQGTSDALDPVHAAAYQANLSAFVDRVRMDLAGAWGVTSNPNTPFVISQVPRFMFHPNLALPNCWACFTDTVRAAEEAVVCSKVAAGLLDASDLSVLGNQVPGGDFIHFDGQGQIAHGQGLFGAYMDLGCPILTSTPGNLSLGSGGSQQIQLNGGPAFANGSFLVLGTLSGTAPGTTLQGIPLPLNNDFYFVYTATQPNQAPLSNSLGLLDGFGRATTTFQLPAGGSASLLGLVAHHAALLVNASSTSAVVSRPTGVRFLP